MASVVRSSHDVAAVGQLHDGDRLARLGPVEHVGQRAGRVGGAGVADRPRRGRRPTPRAGRRRALPTLATARACRPVTIDVVEVGGRQAGRLQRVGDRLARPAARRRARRSAPPTACDAGSPGVRQRSRNSPVACAPPTVSARTSAPSPNSNAAARRRRRPRRRRRAGRCGRRDSTASTAADAALPSAIGDDVRAHRADRRRRRTDEVESRARRGWRWRSSCRGRPARWWRTARPPATRPAGAAAQGDRGRLDAHRRACPRRSWPRCGCPCRRRCPSAAAMAARCSRQYGT